MGIMQLKRSKAQGFDEIPGCVIKDLGDLLILPFCWLFNSISVHRDIPKAWKISKFIPVLKKGNPKLVSNYRPVSNISSVCKVFEPCVLNRLLSEIGPDRLFGSHQHGFYPSRSTMTACLSVQDFISQCLDNNKTVLLYSADLSAAFDMLRSESLVDVLIKLNINPNLVQLIYNFLQKRTSFVQINGSFSSMKHVPLGCVHGSVIGPSLFSLYTRELNNILPEQFFRIAYADDTYVAIVCDETNVDEKLSELSKAASRHFAWLDSIGMCCNRSKTEFTIFDRRGRFMDRKLNIGLDRIRPSSSVKILGLIFQNDLKWNKQLER